MKDKELGVVNNVSVDQAAKRVEVDVSLSPRRDMKELPFSPPGKGILAVPEVGDTVEVVKLGPQNYVARTPLNVPEYDLPTGLSEGDVAVKLSDGAFLHFSNNSDGTVDLEVEVDGDIDFRANQIYVGDSGSAVPVAKHGHTHDFTYTGGGTDSGTLSGTTEEPPAGDATHTEVE